MTPIRLEGLRVTVLGLGVHGGGLAAATWAVARGAEVTVTDLRSESALRSSLERLPAGVRCVLGRHDDDDISRADLVIKNPAVPRDAPILTHARAVTTDIALFLAEWRRGPHGPLVAVTGTKGKSTTASAAAHLLRAVDPRTRLGGNITVSPLEFVDQIEDETVVLELSSFQLGDLVWCANYNRSSGAAHLRNRERSDHERLTAALLAPGLRPEVAIVTVMLTDHQDYYRSMEPYVLDKRSIYHSLADDGIVVFGGDGRWDREMQDEARSLWGEARVRPPLYRAVAERLLVPGIHTRSNMALAAAAVEHLGLAEQTIREASGTFAGVPHRLEPVGQIDRTIAVVNDSAATIPEAALAAVESFDHPVILIAGGSDKGLDMAPLERALDVTRARGGRTHLLAGTATDRLTVRGAQTPVYDDLRSAFAAATASAREVAGSATRVTILLSPGCASFGMFANEFDRGDQFRALARSARES